MNAVSRVSSIESHVAGVQGNALASPSLLPAPRLDLVGLVDVQDALALLYADRLKQGELDLHAVEIQGALHQRASEAQHKKLAEAIAQQRAAERDAKGFWADLKKVASTVAKIATVVASAAAIVMSGGTGAPMVVAVAALVLSSGGMAVRELKLLGKDSDSIGMGMEIAGAAVGVAGGLASAANAGAQAASAAQTASNASSAAATTMKTVKTTAQITAAVATATSATSGVVVADYVRDSELAAADAEEARGHIKQRQQQTTMLIETLRAAKEAESDALAGTMKAIDSCNNAAAVAIAGVRG